MARKKKERGAQLPRFAKEKSTKFFLLRRKALLQQETLSAEIRCHMLER